MSNLTHPCVQVVCVCVCVTNAVTQIINAVGLSKTIRSVSSEETLGVVFMNLSDVHKEKPPVLCFELFYSHSKQLN